MKKYTIGYDIGSSSIKIALVESTTYKSIAVVSEPQNEMLISTKQQEWAEQDPEMWWDYLCKGTQRILKENALQANQIEAVGISYQMHGLVVLDQEKNSLRDAIIWCDSRAVEIGAMAAEDLGEDQFGSHLLNAPGNFTASKLKWVKENEPELYAKVAYFMLPGDYIAFKLTGEIATTIQGLSEAMLWDFKEKKVANWLLNYYGISTDLTPPLVTNFENQGVVSVKGAKQTGLPQGIPLRYRAGDQPNNALALNILKAGEVAATGGTSGVLFAVSERNTANEYYRVNHFAHVNYTPEKPVLGTLLCVNGSGIQYSWLRKLAHQTDYPSMNKSAEKIPIGSEGLVNLPFGNGAERMLYNQSPGAHFLNLNLNRHHQGHLFRAALEGIAFSFAYGMEIMQEDALTIKVIRAGNDNLFRSSLFATTVASLIGQPIEIYNTTGAIGAARAAAVREGGLEAYSEKTASVDQLVTVLPPKNKEAYLGAYEQWKIELKYQLNK
ncbi:MAG: xylulokinase [Flavobacteriaceae bacterium]